MDAALRELVRTRAGACCEYCRIPQSAAPFAQFHVEHVIARQHGGIDDAGNLALACFHCNAHKGPNLSTIDRTRAQLVSLYHPRLQAWDDHFLLREGQVVGKTSCGRATVELLRMNAAARQELRELRS